ncbi:MAG: GNAT family N-acetyltransferase [Anaerolineaceae bacterium]|nr:MAG: GNAT family N-acetyltransferase [Anaerolineaceae bacterium]
MTLIKEIVADNSAVVAELNGDTCEVWDAYVRSAKDGLPLHLSGWRHVLQNTYGYETRYLFAQSAHNIVGVLPLFLLPSRLTGKRAMTMPGGVCADDEQIAHSLIERGMQLACEEGVKRLLIQDSRRPFSNRLRSESQHVYWLLDLPSTEEELWQRLAGNIRRQVRKAKRNGLEVEVGRSEKHLGPFYEMFSQFTHQAGTPVFSQTFLEHVVDTFPDGFNIAIVRHEQQAIAGYFQLEMNDSVYGMWGAALPATLRLRPAYLALWEIMRDAISNGFSHLDMGRSPAEANSSKFKGQWGGTSQPIYQISVLSDGQENAQSMTSQVQSDERFRLFMQIWPRLPFSLTRYLGPKLRWHVPFA